ncbi:MAG: c-type cytochrome, partial [Nevskia sp.]|nr:c-type cytochrome [Nevskia sp.]
MPAPLAAAVTLVTLAGLNTLVAGAPAGDSAQGKKIFVAYCATCHGLDGRGNGPAAAAMLNGYGRRPRDLTDAAYFSKKTDAELIETIKWSGG